MKLFIHSQTSALHVGDMLLGVDYVSMLELRLNHVSKIGH